MKKKKIKRTISPTAESSVLPPQSLQPVDAPAAGTTPPQPGLAPALPAPAAPATPLITARITIDINDSKFSNIKAEAFGGFRLTHAQIKEVFMIGMREMDRLQHLRAEQLGATFFTGYEPPPALPAPPADKPK